jgi:hypothetical protein
MINLINAFAKYMLDSPEGECLWLPLCLLHLLSNR